MTKFAIVDAANLFFRAQHVTQGDAYMKASMSLHIVFRSLRKLFREQNCEHVVIVFEGGSWRNNVYPQYKSARRLSQLDMSKDEKEEAEIFNVVINDFKTFIDEKTRVTVLQTKGIEGDDFIARWIQLHPDDEHVILSGDSDFIQLLAPNVSIFNGVDNRLITTSGVFDGDSGAALYFKISEANGKLKVGETIEKERKKHEKAQKELEKAHVAKQQAAKIKHDEAEKLKQFDKPKYKIKSYVAKPFEYEAFNADPGEEWWKRALFIKCIRGDVGDSVFSAFPGVRYKGSKGKNARPSISEAWEDRHEKTFQYNNFMLQTWSKLIGTDNNGDPITENTTVLKEFQINESLIDLSMQPQDIKEKMDNAILEAIQKEPISAANIGFSFRQFCAKYELVNIAKESNDHGRYLSAGYK